MRGYCDFYEVDPSDEALLALSRTLISDPDQGVQLIARGDDGRALGFATIFWTWSTLSAARLGVMNDLFVSEAARGTGTADALIEACAERCRERGATELAWQTAHTNLRAQAVYERVGAKRDERWLDYSLSVEPGATTPDS
jgi:GNAT superfamily N-acetyltransferase